MHPHRGSFFRYLGRRETMPEAMDDAAMRLALLADLHSNLEAAQACLEHAHGVGVDRFAFLGDIVGYNADPIAVIDLVRSYAAAGAIVVRGNHDAATVVEPSELMSVGVAEAIRWTQRQLDDERKAFLAGLPLTARDGDSFFVHASADAPERWTYIHDGWRAAFSIEAANATYVFSGHVHEPMLYYLGTDQRPQPFRPEPGVPIPVAGHRRWLAIVGSCGQPRDGNPAASYAIFDSEPATLTYWRVPYDTDTAAYKIRVAGLPAEFARRLQRGI
jgi:diadenosine tetraphosphatase ApaH/serine/threonine PP2A family protein phosphatase